MDISLSWLQKYVNSFCRSISYELDVRATDSIHLTLECDELWSFVNNKENQVYVWLALDRDARLMVGIYIGDRSRESAQEL